MKRYFGIALLLFCLLLSAGCGEQPSEKKAAQKLTIGLMPDTDSIPFLIAEEKGYFREEGVEIHLQQYKSAMDRDSALQSGNLDGAVSDLLAVSFAKAGGFDVKATSFTDGRYCLIAGASEQAGNVKALENKDVAVSKNTIIEYITDQILRHEQMPEDSIKKVIIPQIPTRLEMLQNGNLAAATLPEPMGSIAAANGCHYLLSSDELGINPGVIVFLHASIKDKTPEIQAMYRAYNKAVNYLNSADRSEYIDFVVEKSGFPPIAKDALRLHPFHEAALPKEQDVLDCVGWLNRKELIKDAYSYEDIVFSLLK